MSGNVSGYKSTSFIPAEETAKAEAGGRGEGAGSLEYSAVRTNQPQAI